MLNLNACIDGVPQRTNWFTSCSRILTPKDQDNMKHSDWILNEIRLTTTKKVNEKLKYYEKIAGKIVNKRITNYYNSSMYAISVNYTVYWHKEFSNVHLLENSIWKMQD